MAERKVFVTGATGLVGSRVCLELAPNSDPNKLKNQHTV